MATSMPSEPAGSRVVAPRAPASTEPARADSGVSDALRKSIRDVPDFPTKGIIFKDVTPLLADAELFQRATTALAAPFAADRITHVVAIEARGFIFGGPVAQQLGVGLIPVRKAGKLPWHTERAEYALEYGNGVLEIHRDACGDTMRVLVVDDVLATGGTAAATAALIERLGATVAGFSFLIELGFLHGRAALPGRRVETVVSY